MIEPIWLRNPSPILLLSRFPSRVYPSFWDVSVFFRVRPRWLVQLIAWSEKTDETETLISLLDEVDEQLQVMEVRERRALVSSYLLLLL